MNTLYQRQLLLRSYLLVPREAAPEPITHGKKTIWLSIFYLCHIQSGGAPLESEDLKIIDMFLDRWEAAEQTRAVLLSAVDQWVERQEKQGRPS